MLRFRHQSGRRHRIMQPCAAQWQEITQRLAL